MTGRHAAANDELGRFEEEFGQEDERVD